MNEDPTTQDYAPFTPRTWKLINLSIDASHFPSLRDKLWLAWNSDIWVGRVPLLKVHLLLTILIVVLGRIL